MCFRSNSTKFDWYVFGCWIGILLYAICAWIGFVQLVQWIF